MISLQDYILQFIIERIVYFHSGSAIIDNDAAGIPIPEATCKKTALPGSKAAIMRARTQ
jgi:hypothetical protein